MDGRDIVIGWLRDAYTMERDAGEVLGELARRVSAHPDLAARIIQHIEDSRLQAGMIKHCLQDLGTDAASLAGPNKFGAGLCNLVGAMSGDAAIDGALALYAFESYEVATYRALIMAAEEADLPNVRDTCFAILRQDQAMQEWLEQHLPEITKDHIDRADAKVAGADD